MAARRVSPVLRGNFRPDRATTWADRLRAYLDLRERTIRADLKHDKGVAKSRYRQVNLKGALAEVTRARAALARCPQGAQLAYHTMRVQLYLNAPDVEFTARRRRAARDGSAKAAAQRQTKVTRQHQRIRACAAKLNHELSDTRKATIVKAKLPSRLSVRQIRRIIKK